MLSFLTFAELTEDYRFGYADWGWIDPVGHYIDGKAHKKAIQHSELLPPQYRKGPSEESRYQTAKEHGWVRFFVTSTAPAATFQYYPNERVIQHLIKFISNMKARVSIRLDSGPDVKTYPNREEAIDALEYAMT